MAAQQAAEFHQQLEAQRNSLTANQLKKARKRRAKLFHKAAMADLVDGCQPAAKRIKFNDDEEEASLSQLPDHSCCTQHDDSMTADSALASSPQQQGSKFAWHAGNSTSAEQPQQQASQHKPPLFTIKRIRPRSVPVVGHRQAHGQAADMSDVVQALQHQATAEQQAGSAAASDGTAGACMQCLEAANALADAHQGCGAGPCDSSSSRGPCRTDLSGQLVMITQELSSNGSTEHHSSSSSLMQVQIPGDVSASQQCSTHSIGEQQKTQGNAAPEQASGQQPEQQARKKQRGFYQYGNYHHYYGYRIGPTGFQDPRLKVLDQSWFKGADVLDVGCNEGLLTLALAVGCGCRSITGIDIDPVLVAKACTNLSRTRTQLTQQMRAAVAARDACAHSRRMASHSSQPLSNTAAIADGPLSIVEASSAALRVSKHSSNGGGSSSSSALAVQQASSEDNEQQVEQLQCEQLQCEQLQVSEQQQSRWREQREQYRHLQARVVQVSTEIKALTRVSFKAGNWLQLGCPANKYEVVTCFSVTKWIHLNWGDDGLMKLFHKFYRCLAPSGVLVLEPQPWKSYQSAVHKQGGAAAPFKIDQLKLRPENFAEFLTQRVGFEMVQQLNAMSSAAGAEAVPVKGFDRPILVLRKPAMQQ